MPMVGIDERGGDLAGQLARDALEDDRVTAGLLERARVVEELLGLRLRSGPAP